MNFVRGYYNESLTTELALTVPITANANPKPYTSKQILTLPIAIEVDCDLYGATRDVLFWLFENKLVVPGATWFYYDDWLAGGEPKAHDEITQHYNATWTFVAPTSRDVKLNWAVALLRGYDIPNSGTRGTATGSSYEL